MEDVHEKVFLNFSSPPLSSLHPSALIHFSLLLIKRSWDNKYYGLKEAGKHIIDEYD